MRMLLLYILLALLGQQTTVNGQQTPFLESENLKNSESEKSCEQQAMSNEPFLESEESVNISEICGNEKTNHKLVQKKSEKGCEQRAMSNEQRFHNAQDSQHEAQSLKKTVDRCPLSVDYFESQIRLADSLYKNYLPQYNFEEVKAAMEFFDSCEQRAMSNEQRFRKAQSSKLEDQSLKKTVDCCPLTVDIEYQRARAHYYHAVGLTERDDIVGACEHYFIALEIMESEIEKLKTSKSGKGSEQRAMSHEQKFRNAHSSKLEAQSPDYEKFRFLSLIYTRLGELFLSENYCDLAISKYRKALKYVLLLGENKAVANTYKCLGNSYQLCNMPDSALYYYNKSLETNSELPNRLDVEKCIAQILFDRGEKDSAYVMIKNNLGKIENVNIIYSYYNTLGDMYINDKEYDCAIYYLDKSMNSTISDIRVYAAIKLSSIYNIIGDNIKKAYYDNIVSKILIDYNNSNIETSKLQYIYDRYFESNSNVMSGIYKNDNNEIYYTAVFFDNNLSVTNTIDIPFLVEGFMTSYKSLIDNNGDIILVSKEDGTENTYIFVKMNVYGEIKTVEYSVSENYTGLYMAENPLYIHRNDPLEYGCYFLDGVSNRAIMTIILDDNFEILNFVEIDEFIVENRPCQFDCSESEMI